MLVLGGLVLAALTFVLRGDPNAIGLDASAANWGDRESSGFTTEALEAITFIGEPTSVAVLAAIVAAVETARTRSRWVVPFMLLVVAGNGILTTSIKNLADRVRPELNPIAETLGPSFPSGHSSWSAAFFAATALLLARGRGRRARILLTGAAVGAAVGIATHAGPARRALAERRRRRAGARLGVVRGLRDRLRRPAAAVRRAGRGGRRTGPHAPRAARCRHSGPRD